MARSVRPACRPGFAAAAALLTVAVGGCGATTTVPAAELGTHAGEATHEVRLEVDGGVRGASVLYSPGGGHEVRKDDVILPWHVSMTVRAGSYVYVSGFYETEGVEMTCKIFVDGTLERSSSIRHDHSLCQAEATVG